MKKYNIIFMIVLLFFTSACTTKQLSDAKILQTTSYPSTLNQYIDLDNPIQLFNKNDQTYYLMYSSNYVIEASLSIDEQTKSLSILFNQTDKPATGYDAYGSYVFKLSTPMNPESIEVLVDGEPAPFTYNVNALQ